MAKDPIKESLNMIPYGFYLFTTRHEDEVNIMVTNWFSQVSFTPQLVAWGLQKTSHSYGLVEKGRVFAVNIFKKDDEEIVKNFTKSREKNPDKVKNATYTPAPETGCPVVEGAAAYLELKVVAILDVGGDHDVVVGEVINAGVNESIQASDTLTLPHLGWSYAG